MLYLVYTNLPLTTSISGNLKSIPVSVFKNQTTYSISNTKLTQIWIGRHVQNHIKQCSMSLIWVDENDGTLSVLQLSIL